jgi:hypothetical protein
MNLQVNKIIVLGYSSVIVEKGAIVRDCRRIERLRVMKEGRQKSQVEQFVRKSGKRKK